MKNILDKKTELKIANALASVNMDTRGDVIVPEKEFELLRKYAYGEITEDDYLEIIKNELVIPI